MFKPTRSYPTRELTSTPPDVSLCISLPVSGSQIMEDEAFAEETSSHTSALVVCTLNVGTLVCANMYIANKNATAVRFPNFNALLAFSIAVGTKAIDIAPQSDRGESDVSTVPAAACNVFPQWVGTENPYLRLPHLDRTSWDICYGRVKLD